MKTIASYWCRDPQEICPGKGNRMMNGTLRGDAETVVRRAIAAVSPVRAVEKALEELMFPGSVYLAAAGKAA